MYPFEPFFSCILNVFLFCYVLSIGWTYSLEVLDERILVDVYEPVNRGFHLSPHVQFIFGSYLSICFVIVP